jgi:hypothetical protein
VYGPFKLTAACRCRAPALLAALHWPSSVAALGHVSHSTRTYFGLCLHLAPLQVNTYTFYVAQVRATDMHCSHQPGVRCLCAAVHPPHMCCIVFPHRVTTVPWHCTSLVSTHWADHTMVRWYAEAPCSSAPCCECMPRILFCASSPPLTPLSWHMHMDSSKVL